MNNRRRRNVGGSCNFSGHVMFDCDNYAKCGVTQKVVTVVGLAGFFQVF